MSLIKACSLTFVKLQALNEVKKIKQQISVCTVVQITAAMSEQN